MRRISKPTAAFTILELMIVVSTIALVSVLALPAVARARQRGAVQKCILNQRAIFQGVIRYEIDYNSTLYPLRNNGAALRNLLLVREYMTPIQSFDCPLSAIRDNDDYTLVYDRRYYDFVTTSCAIRGNEHLLP